MRFVVITDDSTPQELADAALNLMRRESVVSDLQTLADLDADIAELRAMYEAATAKPMIQS